MASSASQLNQIKYGFIFFAVGRWLEHKCTNRSVKCKVYSLLPHKQVQKAIDAPEGYRYSLAQQKSSRLTLVPTAGLFVPEIVVCQRIQALLQKRGFRSGQCFRQ